MATVALMLTSMGQRRIVDHTGLTGVYDLKLDLAPPDTTGGKSPGEIMQEQVANLFSSMESQWGFKTESIKWQDPVIVVEKAEKPADN